MWRDKLLLALFSGILIGMFILSYHLLMSIHPDISYLNQTTVEGLPSLEPQEFPAPPSNVLDIGSIFNYTRNIEFVSGLNGYNRIIKTSSKRNSSISKKYPPVNVFRRDIIQPYLDTASDTNIDCNTTYDQRTKNSDEMKKMEAAIDPLVFYIVDEYDNPKIQITMFIDSESKRKYQSAIKNTVNHSNRKDSMFSRVNGSPQQVILKVPGKNWIVFENNNLQKNCDAGDDHRKEVVETDELKYLTDNLELKIINNTLTIEEYSLTNDKNHAQEPDEIK